MSNFLNILRQCWDSEFLNLAKYQEHVLTLFLLQDRLKKYGGNEMNER
jgi:hypothetical protein